MTEQIVIWILGVISTLFGGLNIFQWITLRSYKRLKNAEAYQAEINSLRTIIETNQSEIKRLSERIEEYDRRDTENTRRYDELYSKYDALRDEFEQYKIDHR